MGGEALPPPPPTSHPSSPISIFATCIFRGRRRIITVKNGGADELGSRDRPEDDTGDAAESSGHGAPAAGATPNEGPAISATELAGLISAFVLKEEGHAAARIATATPAAAASADGQRRRGPRVQGGWAAGPTAGTNRGGRGAGSGPRGGLSSRGAGHQTPAGRGLSAMSAGGSGGWAPVAPRMGAPPTQPDDGDGPNDDAEQ